MYYMKIKGLIVLTGVIALMLGSCGKSSLKSSNLKSKEDSLSYAFGIVNYNILKTDSLILDPMIVAKAMMDGKEGKPMMADDIARSYLMVFFNQREAVKATKKAEVDKVKYKDYIDQNEAFLVKNKGKAGVTTTASGLQYEVIKMGTGPKPTAQNTVKVNYVGTLIDGTEFDSSVKRNEPATFPVSGVIPGWTEALQLMPVGSKFKSNMTTAEIQTPKGSMMVSFYKNDAPGTVENFITLAKKGFYDGLAFHRVIPDFVIQGGCPLSRDMSDPRVGTGGPGYKIKCELAGDNQYHDRGVLSMAHAGRNTGGSQFFICHSRTNTKHLDRQHTCFGKVFEGLDVIDKIRQGDKIEKIIIHEE